MAIPKFRAIPRLSFSHTACLASLFVVVTLIGCGGESKEAVYATKGTLTLDGEPNGPASFLMVPTTNDTNKPARSVAGSVDAAGAITLTSYQKGDGAPAGEYSVYFTPNLMAGPPKKPIPPVYGNAGTSGLKIRIEKKASGEFNDVSLALDSKAKGKGMGAASAMGPSMLKKNYPTIDPKLMPKTGP